MLKKDRYIFVIIILTSLIFSQELNLQYSKIIRLNPVEESSLVYTGLYLLVQNKFKTIKNKKLAVVFSSTCYTRNGRHILNVMKNEFTGQLLVFIQVLESVIETQSSGLIFSKLDPVSKTNVLNIAPGKLKIEYEDLKGCNLLLYDLQDTRIPWKVLTKKLVTVEGVLSYCGLFFAENTNLSYGYGT